MATKTALITGASRGMGLGYARHYLAEGWRVVATSRSSEVTAALAHLQGEHEDRLLYHPLEVTDPASIETLADRLATLDGGVDLLLSNAGVSEGEPFDAWDAATFVQQFEANAVGPALIARAAAPRMNRGAKLVNVTSGMGSIEWNLDPAGPLAAYAASKAALNALTRRLAALLEPQGVTVVAINPGWVQTEMGGPDAPTTVEDAVSQIAATIERLTPDQSDALLESDGSPMPY